LRYPAPFKTRTPDRFVIEWFIGNKNKKMKTIDAVIAAAIGEVTAIYFWDFFRNLKNAEGITIIKDPLYSLLWLLLLVFPFLAALALWIASLIGKKYLAVFQLAKFLLIGVMATIFDLGILSVALAATGIASGIYYSIFKGASFIVATVIKYVPDKYWAFKKRESSDMKKEFFQFFLVTLVGAVLNIAIASLTVDYIGPQFGIDRITWGKIGGIGATIIVFAWNFVGYKFFVFKK
jgi:putative flippase GtrA